MYELRGENMSKRMKVHAQRMRPEDIKEVLQAITDIAEMEETHKCPVCGGKVEERRFSDGDTVVRCLNCGMMGGWSENF